MGLIQVATSTVTSAVASVTLTAIDTDDVHMVAYNNVVPSTDAQVLKLRVTTSGTADSDSEYDDAIMFMKSDGSFSDTGGTNQNHFPFDTSGTATGEELDGILNLFNFNNSSEYSFATVEGVSLNSSSSLRSETGGFVHTVAEANDGVNFFFNSGNIASGTFTLYKVT